MSGLLACLLILTQANYAEESAKFEKIRDISPNKKFAMRILCDAEPKDPENIDPSSIKAVEIVSLPAKEVVGSLADGIIYDGFSLVWSKDSQWCAFHSSSGSRVSETSAYNLQDGKFVAANAEELRIDVKGDIRNEYIKPLRWLKPGILLLEQLSMFRGGGESTVQFTVRFDGHGKFQVISKKKVPSKE